MGHPEWFPNWMSSYTSEIVVLVLVNVWQYAGMTMIIYLAGLQNISQDLYDAAMIDGATGWQSFRFITLPLLVPSIRINVVTNIIGSLSVFDIVMSLTSGGPGYQTETLSIYIMRMPGETSAESDAMMKELAQVYHVNIVQYYDWMYRHEKILPDEGDEWVDMFGHTLHYRFR